jgi:Ca-activated chloride channel homolog
MPIAAPSHTRVGLCSAQARIPLEHVDVRADVFGAHVRVTFTQRYRNRESMPVEAVYVFPLDEGAAVCGFAAVVDGVRYEGVVKPREDAFADYDDAMAAGHGASLLDEERPDVFTASIGNLAPEAEAQIELTYVAELACEDDSIRFTLPTTISPRYAPKEDQGGVGRSPAEMLNPPRFADAPYGLSFTARVTIPGRIRRIESPSHPISIDFDGDDRATVTLAQEHVALDRDLSLLITPTETGAPQVVLERTKGGRIAAAVTFRPPFAGSRVPADVVFLVDRSGSMQGSSIEQVRNALQICLRSLEAGCTFNIVGFGSTFESMFSDIRAYDENALTEASAYVAKLGASLGGTELLPAIEFVLEQAARRERITQLVVMTDGQVTNTDAVIAAVRRRNQHVRVFTFGIGRGASHHLVRGLARAGGGVAEFVYPGERIEPKVVRLFRRALSPALTDVRLDWGEMAAMTVPSTLGPVFADEPLRAYGLMREAVSGTVTLHARGTAGPMSWSLDVGPADLVEGSIVGTLAARARIREIEEGGAWSPNRGSQQRERRQDRAVGEIIDLAMEFALASRETSWVAVQKREVPLTERASLRRVPLAITSGWGGQDVSPLQAVLGPDSTGLRGLGFVGEQPLAHMRSTPGASMPPPTMPIPSSRSVLGQVFGRPGQPVDHQSILDLTKPSSARVLDRLVALQRADGSWDLTPELADVLGLSFEVLLQQLAHATGDPHEARRALATALALACLIKEASSSANEWKLLAAKGSRWLTGVKAVPAGRRTWAELAAGLSV